MYSAYCKSFKPEFKVIKVFFPEDRPFKPKVSRYDADAFLFDIRYQDKQKEKKTLSRDVLKEVTSLIKQDLRVIISGGLTPDNVSEVKKLKPYAIDVASGVERLPGVKDKRLVSSFIKKVKR